MVTVVNANAPRCYLIPRTSLTFNDTVFSMSSLRISASCLIALDHACRVEAVAVSCRPYFSFPSVRMSWEERRSTEITSLNRVGCDHIMLRRTTLYGEICMQFLQTALPVHYSCWYENLLDIVLQLTLRSSHVQQTAAVLVSLLIVRLWYMKLCIASSPRPPLYCLQTD